MMGSADYNNDNDEEDDDEDKEEVGLQAMLNATEDPTAALPDPDVVFIGRAPKKVLMAFFIL